MYESHVNLLCRRESGHHLLVSHNQWIITRWYIYTRQAVGLKGKKVNVVFILLAAKVHPSQTTRSIDNSNGPDSAGRGPGSEWTTWAGHLTVVGVWVDYIPRIATVSASYPFPRRFGSFQKVGPFPFQSLLLFSKLQSTFLVIFLLILFFFFKILIHFLVVKFLASET